MKQLNDYNCMRSNLVGKCFRQKAFANKIFVFSHKKEAKKIPWVLRLLGFSKGKHLKDYVRSFCSGRKKKPSIYLTYYFFSYPSLSLPLLVFGLSREGISLSILDFLGNHRTDKKFISIVNFIQTSLLMIAQRIY